MSCRTQPRPSEDFGINMERSSVVTNFILVFFIPLTKNYILYFKIN